MQTCYYSLTAAWSSERFSMTVSYVFEVGMPHSAHKGFIARPAALQGGAMKNKPNQNKINIEVPPTPKRPICDQLTPSIDALNTLICDNILAAAKAAIPCTKGESTRAHNNPWWNGACGEAVKTKHYYYKRYRRNCTVESHQEMCKVKIHCKRIIAQAKVEHLKTCILNLDHGANLGSVYKQIKKMKQQYCLPDFDLWEGDFLKLRKQRRTPLQRRSPMPAVIN